MQYTKFLYTARATFTALILLCFVLITGCEESKTTENHETPIETPEPIQPVRVFVEELLPELDQKLHEYAQKQGVIDEITAYVTREAARPFRSRVAGGLRYANILIDIYSPERAAQVFTDTAGLNPRGQAVLEVLDDSGRYMLDNTPYHREHIRKLDEKARKIAESPASPWPTITLDATETEALITWLEQHQPPLKTKTSAERIAVVLDALVHGKELPDENIEHNEPDETTEENADDSTPEPRQLTPVPRVTALISEYLQARAPKNKALAELELRTIDGAMRYARDMRHGKLNRYNWTELNERGGSAAVTLGRLTETFEDLANATPEHIPEVFADLQPKHPQYALMLEARDRYRVIQQAGGWKTVRPVSLELGTRSPRVQQLRERLAIEGYFALPPTEAELNDDTSNVAIADPNGTTDQDDKSLASTLTEENNTTDPSAEPLPEAEPPAQEAPKKQSTYADNVVDQALIDAVKAYQKTHQFRPDGKPTTGFWNSLNVPVERRLAQIELNLTRWLDTHYDGEADYIYVNIPDFHAEVYRDHERQMRFKIVVGNNRRVCDEKTNKWKYVNATPIQWATLDHMILNPSWYVPQRLYDEQLAPKVKKNPNWLQENGYEEIRHKNGRVTVRQLPGPDNSLGAVKFIYPNSENTYMHDTPQRHYFDYEIRGFSSGCVRVHTPIELAKYLIAADGQDDKIDVDEFIESGRSRKVNLEKKIPVFTEYYTVRVDEDGHANFLADIYRYDQRDFSDNPEEFDNCTPGTRRRPETSTDNTPSPAPATDDFGP